LYTNKQQVTVLSAYTTVVTDRGVECKNRNNKF